TATSAPGAATATPATTTASTSAPATTATTTPGGAATTAAATTAAPTTTTPANPDLGAVHVKLTPVAQVTEPIFLATRPGDPSTLYIAERGGRLRALRDGAVVSQPVLDISSMTLAGGERGFLGFAFAPDGNHLYVDYTDREGNSNIDEYEVAADGTVDPASRRQVLFQEQPTPNHNAGEAH